MLKHCCLSRQFSLFSWNKCRITFNNTQWVIDALKNEKPKKVYKGSRLIITKDLSLYHLNPELFAPGAKYDPPKEVD